MFSVLKLMNIPFFYILYTYRAILNVCFAYTSRDEMCTAMKEIAEGVSLGLIKDRYSFSFEK